MISPEPFIQKCRSFARAMNPYLDVVDGHVRLAWTTDDEGRLDLMERAARLGLVSRMICSLMPSLKQEARLMLMGDTRWMKPYGRL